MSVKNNPRVIIVAGPNGAGKTTFAKEFRAVLCTTGKRVGTLRQFWETPNIAGLERKA
jgi:ABC-type Mn2+/Zn2+ transport system ATPase subunit